MNPDQLKTIRLPDPITTGGLPFVETVSNRRSVRDFSPAPLQLFQLSQILWAAQGITSSNSEARAVPSAGATYPLEIYTVVGENGVETLENGIYRYDIINHALALHLAGDWRADLANAALNQDFIAVAPVTLVICADSSRTMARYNTRGERYVFMEVGHAGQDIYLQATALNLGTVAVGAFRDEEVRRVIQLSGKIKPLYIMPVGIPV